MRDWEERYRSRRRMPQHPFKTPPNHWAILDYMEQSLALECGALTYTIIQTKKLLGQPIPPRVELTDEEMKTSIRASWQEMARALHRGYLPEFSTASQEMQRRIEIVEVELRAAINAQEKIGLVDERYKVEKRVVSEGMHDLLIQPLTAEVHRLRLIDQVLNEFEVEKRQREDPYHKG